MGHTNLVDKLLIRPATQTPRRRSGRYRTYPYKRHNGHGCCGSRHRLLTPILATSKEAPLILTEVVDLAVAAPVETVPHDTSRGRLDRTCAAQCGEGRFRTEALWVVTSGDQQSRGRVRTDTRGGEQRRVDPGTETSDLFVEFFDLCCERLISAGQES